MSWTSTTTSRQAYRNLYKRKRWLDLRASVLRQEPLCRYCKALGIETKATVVDHIKPHKGDLRLFFNRRGLAACCESCHNRRKQQYEKSGYGEGCDVNGDPQFNDHWYG